MRFVVYGAGAVGGVLGGALAGAGHDVALIARGAHHDALRRDGLRVESPTGDTTYRLPTVSDPADLPWQPGDVTLLAMKSMDTAAALRALSSVAPPDAPIVCVQNGVANERAALRMFSDVYGVCVIVPAEHLTPGVVRAYSGPVLGILDIGRYPAPPGARGSAQSAPTGAGGSAQSAPPGARGSAQSAPPGADSDPGAVAIAAAFRSAGFRAEPRTDIMRWKYAKLLSNLANAVEALCGPVDSDDSVVRRVREEGMTVLRAAGIDVASEAEDAEHRGDALRIQPVGGTTRGGGSSWQSLVRGTGSIEADYLNGEIVLLGRLHGVPTPCNDIARRLANAHARDGLPPGTLSTRELLTAIDRS